MPQWQFKITDCNKMYVVGKEKQIVLSTYMKFNSKVELGSSERLSNKNPAYGAWIFRILLQSLLTKLRKNPFG